MARFPLALPLIVLIASAMSAAAEQPAPRRQTESRRDRETVDASSLWGKILCGYQGWFRCPGDPSHLGWIHWSSDPNRITPQTLSFEMWPDLREYGRDVLFAAPGFTYPDGRPASLFSSDNAATVLRHFQWLRDYEIDGVWLQHFLVDLPGGPAEDRYPSRRRVLEHVRRAATQTARVWAIAYDIAGMPEKRIFDVLTREWKSLIDAGTLRDPRYLHERGRPVVEIWGFYANQPKTPMTPALAERLIRFFKTPGRYSAFLIGGGDWGWRRNPDPKWGQAIRHLDGYMPWNVGNYWTDRVGVRHAVTDYWADDLRDCRRAGLKWIPVLYPGFSWQNLMRHSPHTVTIPRRRGEFYWEQFRELARLHVDGACIAMFDEVDEGTAIFKVTSTPPVEGQFVGYEGLPSDWYLRLTGEGARLLHRKRTDSAQIPIEP